MILKYTLIHISNIIYHASVDVNVRKLLESGKEFIEKFLDVGLVASHVFLGKCAGLSETDT